MFVDDPNGINSVTVSVNNNSAYDCTGLIRNGLVSIDESVLRSALSIPANVRIPDGAYNLEFEVEDGVGNTASLTFNVTLDKTSPSKPTLDLPEIYDTGISKIDNVTQCKSFTIDVSNIEAG